jgi:ABC-type amino acid transport system permease subunit
LLIRALTGIELGPAANALAVVTLAASAFLGVAQRAGLEAIARQRVEPEDDVANFDELCDASSP